MPYKDEEKKKEYQKDWVRQKREEGSTGFDKGSTGFDKGSTGFDKGSTNEPIPEKPEWWDNFTSQATSEAVPKYKRDKKNIPITEVMDEQDQKAMERFHHTAWKLIQEEHDWWEDREKNIQKMREERMKHPLKEGFTPIGSLPLIRQWVMKGKLANIEPALKEQLLRGFPDGIPEEIKAVLPESISPREAALGILKEIESEPFKCRSPEIEPIDLGHNVIATMYPTEKGYLIDWYGAVGYKEGFGGVHR
jgi:hypothetical protein